MADSHCNVPSELLDTKKCIEDENLQTLASPEEGSTKKKKKRKKKTEESYEEPQVEVCPKPLLDKVIPFVQHVEKAEAITQDPNPTLKKKKKNAQGAQPCDPSLSIGVEPDFTEKAEAGQSDANSNGGLCHKPLLDTPIPIEPLEGNAGTTTPNPNPTVKKKKKKSVQEAQPCDPSMQIGVGPDVTKEEVALKSDANLNENAGTTTQNPDPTPKKKKKKSVQAAQTCDPSIPVGVEAYVTMEGAGQIDANLNGDLCSKPLLDTPIPLVAQDENAGTTTHNPDPTPKKKKKKSVQGEQACDPSIPVGVEADVTKEGAGQIDANLNGDLCSKPLLDTPIPVVAQDENVGTTSQNPNSTPKKKKKKSVQGSQACDPSILIGVEPNIMKEEGAQPRINEECPVPDATTPEDTPQIKKSRKKKNVLKPLGAEPEPESKEANNTENLQQCPPDSEPKIKMKKESEANAENFPVCPKPELAPMLGIPFPNDSDVKKGAEPTEARLEHPQVCSEPKLVPPTDLPTPINPEKKKVVEPSKVFAQPQPCSTPSAEPLDDPTTPVDQSRRKQKSKRGRVKIMCSEEKVENQGSPLHVDIALNQAPNQVQQNPATPICLQPAFLTDQTIPVDPANPIDTDQKMKKKKRKKQKEGEEPNNSKHDTEQPESPIQTATCLIATPSIHPAIPMDPCPVIPICPAISTDPVQDMSKKKMKKKKNTTSIDPPIIPIGTAPPVDTEISLDLGQKMTEKKRKKKKRSELTSVGAEPNEPIGMPPETPVQDSVYPIVAPSIDPIISVSAPPEDTANPIDQGQKTSKKKRKRSDLIREGAELNKHDAEPPGTPVQRSLYPIAAPSIDTTIPTSQASPVDPEQMTKKKKKRKSALKNEGLESEKHNADPSTETSVQKTEDSTPSVDPTISTSQSTPLDPEQMTKKKKKRKITWCVQRCQACRQLGHKFQQCPRLRNLSNNEEICFFCGEIGHSLGKCHAARAERAMFANCLFCHEDRHFSYNCPRNGHGIDQKVL
uniref:Uncharacterized protein C683.02c family n=1 Tax=Cajanus cajan TaxID=3821 RepID=A0A151U685_CAJCA|nr:Uncharacterized protein C683.02c family [Cajanus cajan]